ncbi:MAG: hypothetical protein R3B35_08815 [Gemmatimonadales bacterium]
MTGLLLVATVAACNNDPGVDLSGDPTQIQATPQVMIINQGATEQLLLRLTDDANFSVPAAPYTISDVGPGLTVTFDDTYRPDYTTGVLTPREFQSQHRYTVTATQAVATSFKVSNGGISQVITVKVVPTSIPVSVGAASVTPGQATTITAGNGFSFGDEATFTWNTGGTTEVEGLVIDRAADGSSVTVVPPAGANGAPEIAGAVASYLPTIALPALPATETVSVAQVFSAGPGGAATATIAAPGTPSTFVTGGAFEGNDILVPAGGGNLKWFRFTIATAGTYNISIGWNDTDGDIDWALYADYVTNGEPGFIGGRFSSANPEAASATLPAGTYDIAIIDFANHGPQPQLVVSFN